MFDEVPIRDEHPLVLGAVHMEKEELVTPLKELLLTVCNADRQGGLNEVKDQSADACSHNQLHQKHLFPPSPGINFKQL